MMGMSHSALAVVVLAAGQGTRMKSTTPKVLHHLSGIPLIAHVLATAEALEPEHLLVVVRHERDKVAAAIARWAPDAVCVDQDDIPGTGRALEVALDALPKSFDGDVVVVSGDVPLLDSDTLQAVLGHHREQGVAATVITTQIDDPTGYGRVLRDDTGGVHRIVEQADASPAEASITEVNSGSYVFRRGAVHSALRTIGTHNAQGEKYLTDVVAALADSDSVSAIRVDDSWLVQGINDRVQLSELQVLLNRMVVRGWQLAGVTVWDPASCHIDVGVELASDVEILPGVQLLGDTRVASGAVIGPECTLRDTVVESGAQVVRTHAEGAHIRAGASVGPFSYLRPGADVGEDGKVGAFVEIKNSTLHRGAKVPHLSYIGDADIGEGTNIGAGAITANYDGVAKHRTTVGAHARTGSHTVFVAPVTVGDGAYTAAGAVIRRSVPPGALAVNVAAQRNLEGWVEANRSGTPAATAAAEAADGTTADKG
jgi:bifunctional UDP-N-acetylglucosamine pyrophosphorylase / glucosamine-1-phosphate N-acetyltransferase